MDSNTQLRLLRQMLLIRGLEAEWAEMYRREEFDGTPPALSLGQEAVSVGLVAALEPGDFIFAAHRGQGPQLALGLDPKRVLAEVCSRHTGTNKGKATYHVSDFSRGIIGMGGIIGANAPIAAGMAMSQKFAGKGRVSVCIVGDGTANEGAVSEAVNLAAAWKLPVLFIIENNGYCVSLPARAGMGLDNLADRAAGFGLPGVLVDGNDLMAMHAACAEAVARARTGGGPTWIEARTLRLSGHLAHDPQVYRPKAEVEAGWQNCPVKRFREKLTAAGVLTETALKQMEADVAAEVAEAAEFTRKSPPPPPAEAFQDLWA